MGQREIFVGRYPVIKKRLILFCIRNLTRILERSVLHIQPDFWVFLEQKPYIIHYIICGKISCIFWYSIFQVKNEKRAKKCLFIGVFGDLSGLRLIAFWASVNRRVVSSSLTLEAKKCSCDPGLTAAAEDRRDASADNETAACGVA